MLADWNQNNNSNNNNSNNNNNKVDLTTDEEHHSSKRFVYRISPVFVVGKEEGTFLHLCVSIDNYVKPPTGP